MSTKESKFFRYIKGPAKILARARDFYVRSLTSCAGNVAYGGAAVGAPNLHLANLPRSFSANSAHSDYTSREEDLRELIRLASIRSLTGKVEAELLRSTRSSPVGAGGVATVPRSRTVAIGRIDEDKPYEFGSDVAAVRPEVFPRSKSYAPSTGSGMVWISLVLFSTRILLLQIVFVQYLIWKSLLCAYLITNSSFFSWRIYILVTFKERITLFEIHKFSTNFEV